MTTEPFDTYGAGLLAFIVRDLMAAAGYEYEPTAELAGQAQLCAELIHDHRARADDLALTLEALTTTHRAEVQRLTDLVAELRRQLEGALRPDTHAEQRRLIDVAGDLRRQLADRDEYIANAQANWVRAANQSGQPDALDITGTDATALDRFRTGEAIREARP